MITLDHLAITCADLATGAAFTQSLFGVPLAPGGHHALMSTHNRLLSLGPDEYLEVIAPDLAAPVPPHRRWFGLDAPPAMPHLGAWIGRVDDLDTALSQAPEGAGAATPLARADLRWRMGIAPSGQSPFSATYPWLIEWQGEAHPAPRLPDHGIRLVALTLSHPKPQALRAALPCTDARLHVTQGPPGLSARFATPRGEVTL
jgi:hypothetical protein